MYTGVKLKILSPLNGMLTLSTYKNIKDNCKFYDLAQVNWNHLNRETSTNVAGHHMFAGSYDVKHNRSDVNMKVSDHRRMTLDIKPTSLSNLYEADSMKENLTTRYLRSRPAQP